MINIIEIGRYKNKNIFTPATGELLDGHTIPVGVWSIELTLINTATPEDLPFWGSEEDYNEQIYSIILNVRVDNSTYSSLTSISDIDVTQESFYFKMETQKLYIRFDDDDPPNAFTTIQYEYGEGFNDKQNIDISDVDYDPILQGFPSIERSQDLVGYDKLAFSDGVFDLNNTGGLLDFLISENVYGNDIFQYYIDDTDNQGPYTRDDLVPVASYYIDDYNFSLSEVSVNAVDRRKSEDIDIPVLLFSASNYPDIEDDYKGEPVPYLIGEVRYAAAIPVNGASVDNVRYKISSAAVTSFGTIEVNIDDVWTAATVVSSTLSSGEFVISNGRDTSGSVREARCAGAIGIPVTYGSDPIKIINEEFLGVQYTASNYNTTEWESEETVLTPIGIQLTEQQKLYEYIKIIQDGSSFGFRYEFEPDSRRTIRVDDPDRAASFSVDNIEFENIDVIPVQTDRDLIYAKVRVKYAKDFNSERFLSVVNDDNFSTVRNTFNVQRQIEIETYMIDEADAEARALYESNRFAEIPRIVTLELKGAEYLTKKIYEIFTAPISPGESDLDTNTVTSGREYFGFKRCKIVSIEPDVSTQITTVQAVLYDI